MIVINENVTILYFVSIESRLYPVCLNWNYSYLK